MWRSTKILILKALLVALFLGAWWTSLALMFLAMNPVS